VLLSEISFFLISCDRTFHIKIGEKYKETLSRPAGTGVDYIATRHDLSTKSVLHH
jgi:hypothetical protein